MNLAVLILAATALTSTTACGPKRVVVNGVEMSYEDGATRVFEEGKRAKAAGDPATAKVRFKEVVDLFEDSQKVPDALAELSELLMAEGGCRAARLYLERLAEKYPLSPRSGWAKQSLSGCEGAVAEKPRENAAFTALKSRYERASNDVERREIAKTAADSASAAGDWATAVRWLLQLRKIEPNDTEKRAIEKQIADIVDARVSFQDVRELLEETSGNDFPKALLVYKLGRIQYHTRDYLNAGETLRKYLGTWPGGPYEAGAKSLLALIDARKNVKPKKVGVLLPLSGKNRAYGESALQAIQLAFEDAARSGLELVVRDTKSDRVVAAQATQELALDEGAIAIVGPMFTNEAQPAAYKAQELGIPLVTISSADEIGSIGPYVFRNGLTNAAQAKALVAYAMDVAGMKTFAILYPRHPYGEELVGYFWDEVEKRHGEIRGVESYAMGDTTFSAQVKALVARDVLGLRGDFRKALEECDKQPDNYRKQRCRERAQQDVKPLVDFDGLFIPDYPPNIALVTAALAFEDIIVETEPKYLKKIEKTLGRTVKPVTLLGASGWNSPELPEKAQRNVENAVFTDAFFQNSDDKHAAELVASFQKKYKRSPTAIDALAFDSAAIVKAVIELEKPETRDAMREALRHVRNFPGATGKTSFVNGTDAEKEIRILNIKNGQIHEVVTPSEKDDVPSAGGQRRDN